MDKKSRNWIVLIAFLWILFGIAVITLIRDSVLYRVLLGQGHSLAPAFFLYGILFGLGYLFASVSLFAIITSHRRSTMLIACLRNRWIQAVIVLFIFVLHVVALLLDYSLAFLLFLWAIGLLSPFLLLARSEKQLLAWTGRIFLVVLSILVTTYALEISLRLSAPDLPFDGVKGGVRYTWGHKVVNNDLGFREREFVTPKPPDVYRIMVLGDSITWGAGLSEEERYSNQLEALLSAKYPDREIEVLNFSTEAAPTISERDRLMRYKDVVQPNLIIVGFCHNDPQPKSQNYCVERDKYQFHFLLIAQLRFLGLKETSNFLGNRYDVLLIKLGKIPRWEVRLQRTYDKNSREWKQFEGALRDIKWMSDAMRLPYPIFAVLNTGTSTTMKTDYNHPDEELEIYLKWWHQAGETAREIGFTTVNFEEEFKRELSNEIMAVNVKDGHPSSRMNEIYAQKLFQILTAVAESEFRAIKPPYD